MFIAFKGGHAPFRMVDSGTGEEPLLNLQNEGLTWGQENKIFKSPDMILQFAHYISSGYGGKGPGPKVYANVEAGLNGRPMQTFLPPNMDLVQQPRRAWTAYPWVIPIADQEIQP